MVMIAVIREKFYIGMYHVLWTVGCGLWLWEEWLESGCLRFVQIGCMQGLGLKGHELLCHHKN